jgi:hypothetical protein
VEQMEDHFLRAKAMCAEARTPKKDYAFGVSVGLAIASRMLVSAWMFLNL